MRRRDKINEARIQRAINNLLIPVLQMPALYRLLEAQIASGADDSALAAIAHAFIYGKD